MTVTQALLSFAVIALLLTITPGIDTALVLRSVLTRGRPAAVWTGLGILTGSFIWGAAAAVGASALLAASALAYRILMLAGAAYMAYLGITMIVRTFRRTAAEPLARALPASAPRSYLTGLGTNLLNPKVGVFYVATIPQFIPAHTVPVLMGLALAAVHAVLTVIWFALLIAGGSAASRVLRSPRAVRVVDRLTGVVLIGFGIRVALEPH